MKKNILISLISEQTIPNVELIKEFQDEIDSHIFIHSVKTKAHLNWILNATGVEKYESIEIDAFDINDIETKLRNHKFADDNYVLNITGGTKIMILVLQEFFKNLGARIFYVVGKEMKYIKVFPVIGQREYTLSKRLTLIEYLKAYGFEIKKPGYPFKDLQQADMILKYFLNNDYETFQHHIELIRKKRGKKLDYSKEADLIEFMKNLNYSSDKPDVLNEKETKYLTGEWFEEYVYFKLKQELNLDDDEIGLGFNVSKQNTPNEFDVLFILKHKLYIIECKTSIFDLRITEVTEKNAENVLETRNKTKKYNLLPEIIYKADALKSKLGLFANISILTLEEIKNGGQTPKPDHQIHFERAALSQVGIISKRDFLETKNISELLKIK